MTGHASCRDSLFSSPVGLVLQNMMAGQQIIRRNSSISLQHKPGVHTSRRCVHTAGCMQHTCSLLRFCSENMFCTVGEALIDASRGRDVWEGRFSAFLGVLQIHQHRAYAISAIGLAFVMEEVVPMLYRAGTSAVACKGHFSAFPRLTGTYRIVLLVVLVPKDL